MKFRERMRNIIARDKPQPVELGATGTIFFAGKLADAEYNPDLRDEKAIAVYERMRKGDGQVKAALLACELPLQAAHWDVKAASNSSQDQMIADVVRRNLLDDMTITWQSTLHHVLMMLPFGFSVFEKVWEFKDGLYRWRKLAPRLPATIYKWKLDAEGGLEGIVQQAYVNTGEDAVELKYIPIPVAKLLVFTNEQEGSNFQGISLLRAAYKHWYYKDQLYRIDGIAAERHGVGLAVFTYPAAATTEQKEAISNVGERLHAHERAYVALPDSVKFDLKGVAGQLHDIKGSIEHHDLQIVRSILAQFINLGATDKGSYALSRDQSSFFLMALEAIGRNICDVFNRYAIRQLVDYNWDVKAYPKLTVSGLGSYDIKSYSKAIVDFVKAGVIQTDQNIEEEVRRLLHLPTTRAVEEKGKTFSMVEGAEWQPRRHLQGVEGLVAFKDIKDTLETAEDSFVKAAKQVQAKQIKRIVSMAIEDIESGKVERLATIDVPYHNQMVKALNGVLFDLFEYGKQQVKDERSKQNKGVSAAEPKPIKDFTAYLATKATAVANVLSNKLKAALAWESLRQVREGVVDSAALTGVLTALSDKELEATSKIVSVEAFNLGRQKQAEELKDEIDHVIYSAILDDGTCKPCGSQDGKTFKFGAEWDAVAPPNPKCEGWDRCRCLGVFVYKSEVR